MKPYFLIFIFFTFAKVIYAKNIIFETSGIAKVGPDCFISVFIKDETDLNIKELNLNIFSTDINEKLLGSYVEWIANKRLKAIGYDPIYDIPANANPLPWTANWLSSAGLQVAPQETEVESYIIGGLKQDVDDKTFENFELKIDV